ncbi:hypothetical protein GCM10017779_69630 [Streptomyces capillispiralis]|nr:hypothetical protein GCM10017779_69630 [Streptomyces capillispiralis]
MTRRGIPRSPGAWQAPPRGCYQYRFRQPSGHADGQCARARPGRAGAGRPGMPNTSSVLGTEALCFCRLNNGRTPGARKPPLPDGARRPT